MLSQTFKPWQFPTATNSPLTAPAWSPCPRAFSSPWKAPSPDSTLRSGATVESAQTRGSGWPTCSPRRPWCEGPPGCLWAGWSGWSWSPRIPWGEPHGSHPSWKKTIECLLKSLNLERKEEEDTSKMPSAKMRTALMIVSFDVDRVTSTCG